MFGWGAAEGKPVCAEALAGVGLDSVANDRVGTFSAGMRKRLALARMLVARPSLVLLDEPHAALDADGMALVDQLLGQWHDAGVTVLVASHQAARLASLSDGTIRLDGGLVAGVRGAGVSLGARATTLAPQVAATGMDR
jgi:ABC-type multidrug transport system ATPase subunit